MSAAAPQRSSGSRRPAVSGCLVTLQRGGPPSCVRRVKLDADSWRAPERSAEGEAATVWYFAFGECTQAVWSRLLPWRQELVGAHMSTTCVARRLAAGSNMNSRVFQGRRMIRPAQSCAAVLPGYRLAFNMPGMPYQEPAFAGLERAGPSSDSAAGDMHCRVHCRVHCRPLQTGGGSSSSSTLIVELRVLWG